MKQKIRIKEFLSDLHSGMSFSELMCKYHLTDEALEQICRKLNHPDLSALRRLWELHKLTDSQFIRAFSEVEEDLKGKD